MDKPVRWGDPDSSPLDDLAAGLASMSKPQPLFKVYMSPRVAHFIARRSLSIRAYRRWRGRTKGTVNYAPIIFNWARKGKLRGR